MSKHVALAIILALGATSLARAESAEDQQACTNDAFQFCQAYIPDRDRVFSCLLANRHQISPACQTVMAPYAPAEPKPQKASLPTRPSQKTAKTKGPLNIAPH